VVALVWIDIAGLIGILAACGGLYYLSSRIEPHWVSKDGSRFLTVAQDLDDRGLPIGRRRDMRVHIDPDSDALLVSRRSLLRPNAATWTVKSRSTGRRGRNIYVLKPAEPTAEQVGLMALRVPQRSRVVAHLDSLLERTGDEAVARREREHYVAEQGLEPGATEAFGSPGNLPPDPPADRG
jgi:hypothetical protein